MMTYEGGRMRITTVFAGVAVADFDAALAWYERLLGRPADQRPMEGLAQWSVTREGGIQVVHDAGRAGTAMVTLTVDDVDGSVAALQGRGLTPEPITTGTFARFTTLTDPAGNTITLAKQRDPAA
jgi:predicted enzyme related to lactoylglutathione lyase